MQPDLEFLLSLLDEPAPEPLAQEDFDGRHSKVIRLFQRMGFVDRQSGVRSACGCPHCEDGVSYRVAGRLICNHCASIINAQHLQRWHFHREAVLRWLGKALQLRGEVQPINGILWQLGTWISAGNVCECFYGRSGRLSQLEQERLDAYRSTVLLYGLSPPSLAAPFQGARISLMEILRLHRTLSIDGAMSLTPPKTALRFDQATGSVFVGGRRLGEVSLKSREYFFLELLAARLDSYVAYSDLKHHVLRQSGSRDSTDEATFCHRLKSRIKRKIPEIDTFVATTNKADGYRLRAVCPREGSRQPEDWPAFM